MEEIKISIEKLSNSVKRLNGSIEGYKPLMEKFVSFTRLDLEKQKSDFCVKGKMTLNNMEDVYSKKNVDQVEKIYVNGEKILKEFKETDEKMKVR